MLRIFGWKPKRPCSNKPSFTVPNPTSEGNMSDSASRSCSPLRGRVTPLSSDGEDHFSFVADISRDGDLVEDKKIVFEQLIPSSAASLVKHHCWTSEEEETETESSESLNLRQNKEEEDDRQKLKTMWVEALYENVAPYAFIDGEELENKARAAEELAQSLWSEEMELTKTSYDGVGGGKGEMGRNRAESMIVAVETLQQKVKTLLEEKRNLALDLSCEIRSRMTEKYVANEAFMVIQKEKDELQSSLQKELNRRSSECANKQEKIKFGERRLRDRIRDLAVQNVALQREVLDMKNKEANLKNQLTESEHYRDRLNIKLKDSVNEIAQLRQALKESEIGTKKANDTLQSIKRCYDEERESYGLKKSYSRLQWLLKDHERAINRPLWNSGLKGDINEHMAAELQQEKLIRVSGSADQHSFCKDKLADCKSSQSYHERLRKEKNTDGLQGSRLRGRRENSIGNGLHGLMKLVQELCPWLDEMQTRSLLLFDENRLLCSKLLETLKYKSNVGLVNGQNKTNAIVVNEHEMDVQMLEKKACLFKDSVNMVKGILKEITLYACNEDQGQKVNWRKDSAGQLEDQYLQLSELQDELKAQTLITRLVREKLCSRVLEVEQLQEDVAMLLKNRELSKAEIKKMQHLLGTANHKVADLESQLGKKNEIVSGLEGDLQRCLKQIKVLKEDLGKVSKDKDMIREEREQLDYEVMRLDAEVEASQKIIEKLDEDVMIKNGQISILRESLQEFYCTNIWI